MADWLEWFQRLKQTSGEEEAWLAELLALSASPTSAPYELTLWTQWLEQDLLFAATLEEEMKQMDWNQIAATQKKICSVDDLAVDVEEVEALLWAWIP